MGLAQQLDLSNQPCAQGVDYILGADTHERIREPLQGKFSKVTEPGAFASFVGKLDIVVENGRDQGRDLRAAGRRSRPVRRRPGDDAAGGGGARAVRKEIERVIGTTKTPLLRYYVIETPMDNLITDALMWKFDTDFVVSNGFRFCPPLVPPPGGEAQITDEYLWSMLPVDSTIKSATVTGQQILDWLEKELRTSWP